MPELIVFLGEELWTCCEVLRPTWGFSPSALMPSRSLLSCAWRRSKKLVLMCFHWCSEYARTVAFHQMNDELRRMSFQFLTFKGSEDKEVELLEVNGEWQ